MHHVRHELPLARAARRTPSRAGFMRERQCRELFMSCIRYMTFASARVN